MCVYVYVCMCDVSICGLCMPLMKAIEEEEEVSCRYVYACVYVYVYVYVYMWIMHAFDASN
jgi:hypothetical protein